MMKRSYNNQDQNSKDTIFFVGTEVEHTPAYGERTLFVVGARSPDEVINKATEAKASHVYLGANKSFTPEGDWEALVDQLLHRGYWVTLDFASVYHSDVIRMLNNHMRHSRFIPMISVEIPNVELFNYNTVIKIDDVGFDETNPGVWCHYLSNLLGRDRFTSWSQYHGDEVIK